MQPGATAPSFRPSSIPRRAADISGLATPRSRIAIGAVSAPLPDFLGKLDPRAAERVGAAVASLAVGSGTPFADSVTLANGAAYALDGRRSAGGDAVLWLTDLAPVKAADTARAAALTETAAVRTMIDAIPLPVWRRDSSLALVDCNAAYAAALDTTREAALAEGRELAPESGRGKALELARAAAAGATAHRAAARRRRRLAAADRDHRDT